MGTQNEPKTASMPVIASPSIPQGKLREAISCLQSLERGDCHREYSWRCFVAPLLAMTPPERLRKAKRLSQVQEQELVGCGWRKLVLLDINATHPIALLLELFHQACPDGSTSSPRWLVEGTCPELVEGCPLIGLRDVRSVRFSAPLRR